MTKSRIVEGIGDGREFVGTSQAGDVEGLQRGAALKERRKKTR